MNNRMAIERPRYKIILSKEVVEFFRQISPKAVRKLTTIMDYVAAGEINVEFFKKLGDTDIWEFRAQMMGIAYRLLSFWDTSEHTLIITTHGFIKKTQKTPQKEIEKAERKRKEYFENKK